MEEVINLANGHHLSPCTDVYAVFQHFHLQALDNGLGTVGGWKDTTVVLHLELDPIFLKEIHDVVVVKLGKDAVKKAAVARNASQQVFKVPLLVTLQRPPPVPDSFLPKRLFFEEQGFLAVKAGRNSGHHASRPRSDNNSIYCIHAFIVSYFHQESSLSLCYDLWSFSLRLRKTIDGLGEYT